MVVVVVGTAVAIVAAGVAVAVAVAAVFPFGLRRIFLPGVALDFSQYIIWVFYPTYPFAGSAFLAPPAFQDGFTFANVGAGFSKLCRYASVIVTQTHIAHLC